jgi:hypothetical protein
VANEIFGPNGESFSLIYNILKNSIQEHWKFIWCLIFIDVLSMKLIYCEAQDWEIQKFLSDSRVIND